MTKLPVAYRKFTNGPKSYILYNTNCKILTHKLVQFSETVGDDRACVCVGIQ